MDFGYFVLGFVTLPVVPLILAVAVNRLAAVRVSAATARALRGTFPRA